VSDLKEFYYVFRDLKQPRMGASLPGKAVPLSG
jgi:hypothetical protein